jgi:hypothetical protein
MAVGVARPRGHLLLTAAAVLDRDLETYPLGVPMCQVPVEGGENLQNMAPRRSPRMCAGLFLRSLIGPPSHLPGPRAWRARGLWPVTWPLYAAAR